MAGNITIGDITARFSNKGKDEAFHWLFSQSPNVVNKVTLKKKFEKLINQFKNILKSKNKSGFNEKLEKFEKDIFVFPKSIVYQKRISGTEIEIKHNVKDIESAKNVINGLANDYTSVRKKNDKLSEVNEDLSEKLKSRLATKSRLSKQIMEKKILKRQVKNFSKLLNDKNRLLKQLRASKTYIKKKGLGYAKKCSELKSENEILKRNIETLNKELKKMKNENNKLMAHCENIQDTCNKSTIVELFDKDMNCYNPETQECVYKLLNLNVTTSKVSPVLSTVLSLVKMKPDRLPSTSTINNMNVQRLIASHKHLAEILPNEKNLCLLSDETSKFGKKMEGFHVSTENRDNYILGTRQIVTKSGQDTLSVLNSILDDINETSKSSSNEVSKAIMLNISSTMSDRASTQLKFNDLLESYRKDVLMLHYSENWEQLSENEKLSLTSLNNFFCGLHSLVHVAGAAGDSMKVLEEAYFDKEIPIYDSSFKNSESGTVRLVRTASKAFSCGGDEKSGVYGNFQTFSKQFLVENKLNSIPIKRYHGNRFNILFENASCVFFMHEKLKEYLDFDHSNKLLKAVKHDLDTPFFVAGLKALGLIHYLITAPLWTFIERKDIHIFESSNFHVNLCRYIEQSVKEMHSFTGGNLFLDSVNQEHLMTDVIFKKLIDQSDYDDNVEVILKTMLPAILVVLKKLFADFINNGKWTEPTIAKTETTKSVPMHNKFSETVFGHIDRLLREKPNISFLAQEAYVMFCHNKTIEWIEKQHVEKKKEIFTECRKEIKTFRSLFKQRRREIEQRRKQLIDEKIKEKEEKEKKRLRKLEEQTSDIIEWGLWQSIEQVEQHLESYKTNKEKVKALKAQINFRKNVLIQKIKDNDKVFRVTKTVSGKSRQLSVTELSENVKTLIQHSYTIQAIDDDNDGMKLVGMNVSMKFEIDSGVRWYDGHVISKVQAVLREWHSLMEHIIGEKTHIVNIWWKKMSLLIFLIQVDVFSKTSEQ